MPVSLRCQSPGELSSVYRSAYKLKGNRISSLDGMKFNVSDYVK